MDYVNAVLIPILIGYLFFTDLMQKERISSISKARNYLALFLSSLLGVLLVGSYNQIAFGNFFTSSEQLYLHSTTFFGNFNYPIYNGIILNLFTPFRGVLIFSPILILGIFGFYEMIWTNKVTRVKGVFLLAIFFGLLLPYSAWYDVAGGLSYGARFVVPAIPFLLIPGGSFIDKQPKKYRWLIAYALYAAGVIMNGMAGLVSALGPGDPPGGYTVWTYYTFISSSSSNSSTLVNFAKGILDTWWKIHNSLGSYWWIGASLIITTALVLPVFFPGEPKTETQKDSVIPSRF